MTDQHTPALAYTIEQASERTNITRTKLWQAIKDGRLQSFRVGRSRRISERALREYIESLEAVEAEVAAG